MIGAHLSQDENKRNMKTILVIDPDHYGNPIRMQL